MAKQEAAEIKKMENRFLLTPDQNSVLITTTNEKLKKKFHEIPPKYKKLPPIPASKAFTSVTDSRDGLNRSNEEFSDGKKYKTRREIQDILFIGVLEEEAPEYFVPPQPFDIYLGILYQSHPIEEFQHKFTDLDSFFIEKKVYYRNFKEELEVKNNNCIINCLSNNIIIHKVKS